MSSDGVKFVSVSLCYGTDCTLEEAYGNLPQLWYSSAIAPWVRQSSMWSSVAAPLRESERKLYNFSPDSRRLFIVHDGGFLSIYDVAACTDDLAQLQKEHHPCGTLLAARYMIRNDHIYSMAISENGDRLALGDGQGEVLVFNISELLKNPDNKCPFPLATFKHAEGFVNSFDHEAVRHVTFNKDGSLVMSSADDGTAKVWRVGGAEVGYPKDEAVSENTFGKHLSRLEGWLRVKMKSWLSRWLNELYPVVTLKHDERVQSAVFSPDGRKIISVTQSNLYCFWDFNDETAAIGADVQSSNLKSESSEGAHRCYKHKWLPDGMRSMFSPDGKLAVLSSPLSRQSEFGIDLWSTQALLSDDTGVSATPIATLKHYSGTFSELKEREEGRGRGYGSGFNIYDHYGITLLAFSYDGKFVITAAGNGSVMLWDVSALRELKPGQEAKPVKTLQFPDPILNIHTSPGYSGIKIFSASGPVTTWYPSKK